MAPSIGESLVNSFEPDIYIKVAKVKDGEPSIEVLKEVYRSLGNKHYILLDTKKGVIYLKKKGGK